MVVIVFLSLLVDGKWEVGDAREGSIRYRGEEVGGFVNFFREEI